MMRPGFAASLAAEPSVGRKPPHGWGITMTAWPVLAFALLLVDEPFRSAEEVQSWLTYYYLKPRPELALKSLAIMDRELRARKGRSLADEVERGGMRSFYARVFADNPKVADEAGVTLAGLPAGQKEFVVEALRRCGTAACKRSLPKGDAAPSATVAPDPGTLDDSWASFSATGDAKYVREVIDVLPWVEVRGDVNRLLTGGAAKWSLASNAYQHTRVLTILEQEVTTAKPPTKALLQELIEGAKAERAKSPPPEPH